MNPEEAVSVKWTAPGCAKCGAPVAGESYDYGWSFACDCEQPPGGETKDTTFIASSSLRGLVERLDETYRCLTLIGHGGKDWGEMGRSAIKPLSEARTELHRLLEDES